MRRRLGALLLCSGLGLGCGVERLPEQTTIMAALIESWRREQTAEPTEPGELPDEVRKRLEALGYVE